VFSYLARGGGQIRSTNIESTIVLFVLVAGLGPITVVALDLILTMQEAEAKCRVGGTGYNASKGRCIQP
jgi:hypothetical protein